MYKRPSYLLTFAILYLISSLRGFCKFSTPWISLRHLFYSKIFMVLFLLISIGMLIAYIFFPIKQYWPKRLAASMTYLTFIYYLSCLFYLLISRLLRGSTHFFPCFISAIMCLLFYYYLRALSYFN